MNHTKNQVKPPSTAELLAKLATMRDQAGEKMFERIQIACQIYADKIWIVTHFEGDAYAAAEHLERQYLGDLCMAVRFQRLQAIYQKVPDIADWREQKFDLKAINALAEERTPKPDRIKSERKTATVAELEAAKADKEQAEKELVFVQKRHHEEVHSKDQRIAVLEAQVSDLKLENATLKGQLRELQRIVGQRSAELAVA